MSDSKAGKVLVAVAAHADDVEFNAGGFVARWVAEGGSVHIVMVTNNCLGDMIVQGGGPNDRKSLPPAETTEVRHQEQDKAAQMIGATVHHLGYRQRGYWDGEKVVTLAFDYDAPAPEAMKEQPPLVIAYRKADHVQRLADLLISLKPDLVLTQTMLDIDTEHHAVASFTWTAIVRNREQLPMPLWFWSPGTSCRCAMMDPHYEHIEDISAFYQQKLALCGAHYCQMTQGRYEMIEARARYWGERIGVEYAEAFKEAHFPVELTDIAAYPTTEVAAEASRRWANGT